MQTKADAIKRLAERGHRIKVSNLVIILYQLPNVDKKHCLFMFLLSSVWQWVLKIRIWEDCYHVFLLWYAHFDTFFFPLIEIDF